MVDTEFVKSQLNGSKLALKCIYVLICMHMLSAHLTENNKRKNEKKASKSFISSCITKKWRT